jgi:hypothetical protein
VTEYTAWLIPEDERERLLDLFPPRYPDVIAHHVTDHFPANGAPLSDITTGTIIGHADDGIGIEALIVEIDGSAKRWDGKVLHITWSMDRSLKYSAWMSNRMIAKDGFKPTDERIPIKLEPRLLNDT